MSTRLRLEEIKKWYIVCSDTPGLTTDSKLMAKLIERNTNAVAEVVVCSGGVIKRATQILRPTKERLFGLNRIGGIFVEDIRPAWLSCFDLKVLLPNPEWMRETTISSMFSMDAILCKSLHAAEIFKNKGFQPDHLGFTSTDRFEESIVKDFRAFLHLQGRSMQKGTLELLRVWTAHPEWPILNVVSRDRSLNLLGKENIHFHFDYLTDVALSRLMNRCGVHVCTSTAEGFGHSINEARSCGALVISTNAPPMNELTTQRNGFLVDALGRKPLGWSHSYTLSESSLEQTIEHVLRTSPETLALIGKHARDDYLIERTALEMRLRRLLSA